MNRILSYIIALLVFCSFEVKGQEQILPISDVEVVKAFEAKLKEAKVIEVNPELKDPTPSNTKFSYPLNIDPLNLNYPDPKIRPLSFYESKETHLHHSWVKAGFGNLKRPSIELSHFNYVEDQYHWSVFGSYHGGKESDSLFANLLTTQLTGEYFISENWKTSAQISFSNENRSLRPYDNSDSLYITQGFQSILLAPGIHTQSRLLGKLDLGIDLVFRNNRINRKNKEEDPLMQGYLQHKESIFEVPVYANLHLSETSLISIHNSFSAFKSDGANYYGNQVKAKFHSKKNNLHFDLGFSAVATRDSIQTFPELEFAYKIENSGITVSLGAYQNAELNSIEYLYSKNPYVLYDDNNSKRIFSDQRIFAGLQYSKKSLNANLKSGYQIIDNIADFLYRDQTYTAYFLSGNAIFIESDLTYTLNQNLSIDASAVKTFYSLDGEHGLPDFEATTSLTYRNENKWMIKPSFSFRSAANILQETSLGNIFKKENTLLDFSIYADYFFSEHVGFYVEANNLFNQKYLRWTDYPDFGINIYGGFKAKF